MRVVLSNHLIYWSHMHKRIHEKNNCQLIVNQKRYRTVKTGRKSKGQENWDRQLHSYYNGAAEESGTRIYIK